MRRPRHNGTLSAEEVVEGAAGSNIIRYLFRKYPFDGTDHHVCAGCIRPLGELREPLRRRPFVVVDEGDEGRARGSYGTIACPCKAAHRLDEIRQTELVENRTATRLPERITSLSTTMTSKGGAPRWSTNEVSNRSSPSGLRCVAIQTLIWLGIAFALAAIIVGGTILKLAKWWAEKSQSDHHSIISSPRSRPGFGHAQVERLGRSQLRVTCRAYINPGLRVEIGANFQNRMT